MFSRLMFSAYTPRNPPPSTKNEKFCSNGSRSPGGEGGSGAGAGCWASPTPAARIKAATRPTRYFAFMKSFLRKSFRLTRNLSGRVPKRSEHGQGAGAGFSCTCVLLLLPLGEGPVHVSLAGEFVGDLAFRVG